MNVLVPVSFSRTIDRTVEYALERVAQEGGSIHLVHTETPGGESRRDRQVNALLHRLVTIANEQANDRIGVETAYLARERYLTSPHDHAGEYAAYAREHDIDLVIMDPGFSVDATDPILQPVHHAFDRVGLRYAMADVSRSGIPSTAETARFLTVSSLSLVFYLAVSQSFTRANLLVGVVGAILTGLLFRNVVFETTPQLWPTVGVFVRGIMFIPYLLAKILVANIQISYLVLHPALPIDPHLDRIETGLSGGLSVTGLANSLTLTPGTLTVDAVRDELLVHSITPETRRELLTGDRQRAIEFVYYGRAGISSSETTGTKHAVTVAGPIDASEILPEETNE